MALLDARQQLCAMHGGKLPPKVLRRFNKRLSRVKSTLHLRAQSVALDGEIEVRQTHLETLASASDPPEGCMLCLRVRWSREDLAQECVE